VANGRPLDTDLISGATKMPMRVLIIDDSATSRMAQQVILREGGYDISTAEDAEEGIALARAERPDLVLLDVMMPGMDGFTACQALRGYPETRLLPIILVTSERAEGSVEAGFACGCSDYVLKPIDRIELLAKIENFLSAGSGGISQD
jgi:CheY-like chemotaxis protein